MPSEKKAYVQGQYLFLFSGVNKRKYNYIDLFAGCGGLSLGLFESGFWHGKFAIEKSPDAFETLKFNLIDRKKHFSWPRWLKKTNYDIESILTNHRGDLETLRRKVDLVAGGPPCQGFSVAGRRIEKDQRNCLIFAYLDFIELIQPKMIFFENVKGFELGFKNGNNKRGQPYSALVLDRLHKLGYSDAQAHTLNFTDYGIPQERHRCIIIGTRSGVAKDFFVRLEKKSKRFLLNKNLSNKQTLRSAISDIERRHGETESIDSAGFKNGRYFRGRLSSYQKLMKGAFVGLPDSHRFAKHTPEVEKKFRTVIKEKLTSKEVQYLFNTCKTSTKLLLGSRPSPTLTTLPDDYVHYCEPRILTVREYARIQSFPDWYQFKGKYTTGGRRRRIEVPRYSQIGNAIPPLFGELIGITLKDLLDEC